MSESAENTARTRYSDEELLEFKELILEKLEAARSEFRYYQEQIMTANANGTDDTSSGYVTLEEGSAAMDKEHYSQLAARQRKFIDHLENALIRIENKTYGKCEECGNFVGKARLQVFPRATLCMVCKQKEERR